MRPRFLRHLVANLATTWAFASTYLLGAAALVVGLSLAHSVRNYNSDDTAQQSILGIWQRGFHNLTFVPVDNYLFKTPLYALTAALSPDPRSSLLATTLILNLTGFTLFALGARYFWRHLSGTHHTVLGMALVWLATLGYGFYNIILNPNTRNVEIGLAFLSLAGFARYLRTGVPSGSLPGRLIVAASLPLLGLFIYSSAYYLIFFLAPLGLLAVLSMVVAGPDPRQVRLLVFLAAGALVSLAWRLVFRALDIVTVGQSVEFVTVDEVGPHLRLLIDGTLTVSGANLLGREVVSFTTAQAAARLALLLIVLAYPVYLVKTYRLADELWRFYFALLPYFAAVVFLATSYVADSEARRYLVVVPFAVAITIGFVYEELRLARLRALMAALLACNILLGLLDLGPPGDVDGEPNAANREIIALVHSLDLDKGYADYWLSGINTYLSGDKIDFIQAVCVDGRLRPYRWFTDDGILEKPAARTFYLYDARRSEISACDVDTLEPQLGPPAQLIEIDKSTQLAVYDYDIASVFDER